MIWLFGIALLFFLIISEGFRAFTVIVIVLGIVIGIVVWQYNEIEERQSKKRILVSELILEDTFLKPDHSGYNFISRITNKSNQYTLNRLSIIFTFKDCKINNANDCVVVAEKTENIYIKIPPKQARDIEENIYLNPKIMGRMVWNYSIVSTTGK